MYTVVTQLTDAPQFMHMHAHTHCVHTHYTPLHAHCMQSVQTTSFSAFEKLSLSVRQLLSQNFEHFFGILSPYKILSKSSLCLDLLLSVTPLSLFFCLHSLVVGGMANRMGMMVGESKSFLILIGIIDYFCNILSRNIGILGHYQFSELSPLGTKGRQE